MKTPPIMNPELKRFGEDFDSDGLVRWAAFLSHYAMHLALADPACDTGTNAAMPAELECLAKLGREARLNCAAQMACRAAQMLERARAEVMRPAAPPAAAERATFRLQAESEDAVVALTRALGADFVSCTMVRRDGWRVFKVHACLKLKPDCTRRTIRRAAKRIPMNTWRKRFRIVG